MKKLNIKIESKRGFDLIKRDLKKVLKTAKAARTTIDFCLNGFIIYVSPKSRLKDLELILELHQIKERNFEEYRGILERRNKEFDESKDKHSEHVGNLVKIIENIQEELTELKKPKKQDPKKYSIEDLANGKCAVVNDGDIQMLADVLKKAFPNSREPMGDYKYYEFSDKPDIYWTGSDSTYLPKQSAELFL